MSDEEIRARFRLDQQAFDRLPEEVKAEILKKQKGEQISAAEYQRRLARRRRDAAILGAAGNGAICLATLPNFVLLALMLVSGAALGWLIVEKKLGHIWAILLFGGNAIVWTIPVVLWLINRVGPTSGGGIGAIVFGSWLFYMGLGYAVAKFAEDKRGREDMGF